MLQYKINNAPKTRGMLDCSTLHHDEDRNTIYIYVMRALMLAVTSSSWNTYWTEQSLRGDLVHKGHAEVTPAGTRDLCTLRIMQRVDIPGANYEMGI